MTSPTPDVRYTESHEWAKQDGGEIVVGITAFAVKELQDLVFITLPKPGTKVQRGKRFGEIESVKAVVDLFSPVDGAIAKVNDALDRDLDILANDPFGAGWMIRVKPEGTVEEAMAGLMDGEGYGKHTASSHH